VCGRTTALLDPEHARIAPQVKISTQIISNILAPILVFMNFIFTCDFFFN
jgi:hypothetical protein